MSGTDKTKTGFDLEGPAIILVEPQLGENIGTCARAMANFGLSELRLIRPRDKWPNPRAVAAASGAITGLAWSWARAVVANNRLRSATACSTVSNSSTRSRM